MAQPQPAEVDKQPLTTCAARKIWGEAQPEKMEVAETFLREWLEKEKNISLSKREEQINASELERQHEEIDNFNFFWNVEARWKH